MSKSQIFYRNLLVISTALILAAMNYTAKAELFGIKFLGNTTDGVTGTSGVVPVSGWTNIANANNAPKGMFKTQQRKRVDPKLHDQWHDNPYSDYDNSLWQIFLRYFDPVLRDGHETISRTLTRTRRHHPEMPLGLGGWLTENLSQNTTLKKCQTY